MQRTSYIYADSCVFLAYLNNQPVQAEVCDQLFEAVSRDRERKLLTSTHSLVEVAYVDSEKKSARLAPDTLERIDALWMDNNLLEIDEYSEVIARAARSMMRSAILKQRSLKPSDAVHLATAAHRGVQEFFTYDRQLLNLSIDLPFTIKEPYVIQPRLLP
jgi:predicted nucleic acid-binding protein